ncbi:MAG: biopolymer transporter ExbD [Synergistaceae bacterium]|nr:biopolymer transporter ExbD [Synergistaceae bacterium]
MKHRRKIAELDITSLIDVLFMLIIFFVLTASFISTNVTVDLPKSYNNSSNSLDASNVITLNKDGSVFLNSQKVSKEDVFKRLNAAKDKGILLIADKSLHYGTVVEFLSLLQKNCTASVGLVTTFAEE